MKGKRPDGYSPRNMPIGSETIRPTGASNKLIWFVKISNEHCGGDNKRRAPYQWEKKHLLVWRKANGEIPSGHKIVFLNSDTLDCRLENLYMTTDAAHMMMVKYGWYSTDPTLTKTALKCCELEQVVRKANNSL